MRGVRQRLWEICNFFYKNVNQYFVFDRIRRIYCINGKFKEVFLQNYNSLNYSCKLGNKVLDERLWFIFQRKRLNFSFVMEMPLLCSWRKSLTAWRSAVFSNLLMFQLCKTF